MRLFYADHDVLPLSTGYRFPMGNHARLRERFVSERVAGPDQLFVPRAARGAGAGG